MYNNLTGKRTYLRSHSGYSINALNSSQFTIQFKHQLPKCFYDGESKTIKIFKEEYNIIKLGVILIHNIIQRP